MQRLASDLVDSAIFLSHTSDLCLMSNCCLAELLQVLAERVLLVEVMGN
jgi:hypothetical protein